jgi:hypothetical protein
MKQLLGATLNWPPEPDHRQVLSQLPNCQKCRDMKPPGIDGGLGISNRPKVAGARIPLNPNRFATDCSINTLEGGP